MTSISPPTSPTPATDRLRPKHAANIAAVSIGLIYRWMSEGKLRSWVVTRRGYARGVRFIDPASFEEFLQSQKANEQ